MIDRNKNRKCVRLPLHITQFIERQAKEVGVTESDILRTLICYSVHAVKRMADERIKAASQVPKLGFWAGLSERYTDWLMGGSLLGTWF